MASISYQFHDQAVIHAVDLLRFAETPREAIVVMLTDLGTELEQEIRDADITVPGGARLYRKQESLIRQAQQTIASAYRDIGTYFGDLLVSLATAEGSYAVSSFNAIIGAELASQAMTPKDLEVLAGNTIIQGSPAKDWWAKQSSDAQMRFAQQIRTGVIRGETNDQLVERILGSKTGRRRVITDSQGNTRVVELRNPAVLETSRREATALVRSSVQAVSNEVLERTYDDNQDIIKGTQWLATLDPRTCIRCMALDLGAWDSEGNLLPESKSQLPYPGRPPLHMNCRCVIIPLLYSWQELSDRAGGKLAKKLDQISSETRASMDGQISGSIDYESWLKDQSEARQIAALGPTRAKLFAEGNLTLSGMVDQSGRALTLAEIYG